ncbi:hypothetical protein [Bifidobacterium aquikefiricola]|uniref:GNAT family protein n=1 Tax=Bifidobacterium aquikefiricola TaxID=3059038 RepID=A0AB39U561_9BIFI
MTIVVSRECTADDIRLLRQFSCCGNKEEPKEYEIDPQRYIRGLKESDFDEKVTKTILTTAQSEKIFAFAEYGYIEESDTYAISWIARSSDCSGNGLGASILLIVLDDISVDSFWHNRSHQVLTQIDPRNEASIRMFENAGFEDGGVDSTDQQYHIWHRTICPHGKNREQTQFIIPKSLMKR